MGFREYLNENFLTWQSDLTVEIIADLKVRYERVEICKKNLSELMQKATDPNVTGIEGDIEKAQAQLDKVQQELDIAINYLKTGTYAVEENTKSTNK